MSLTDFQGACELFIQFVLCVLSVLRSMADFECM